MKKRSSPYLRVVSMFSLFLTLLPLSLKAATPLGTTFTYQERCFGTLQFSLVALIPVDQLGFFRGTTKQQSMHKTRTAGQS